MCTKSVLSYLTESIAVQAWPSQALVSGAGAAEPLSLSYEYMPPNNLTVIELAGSSGRPFEQGTGVPPRRAATQLCAWAGQPLKRTRADEPAVSHPRCSGTSRSRPALSWHSAGAGLHDQLRSEARSPWSSAFNAHKIWYSCESLCTAVDVLMRSTCCGGVPRTLGEQSHESSKLSQQEKNRLPRFEKGMSHNTKEP